MDLTRSKNPARTVLTIATGFLIIYLITHWNWAIYVSLGIGLSGVISNKLSKWIDFLWMRLAKVLSFIIPNILLGLIFYAFLFPLSLFAKIGRKTDPLYLKNKRQSQFVDLESKFDRKSFENPW